MQKQISIFAIGTVQQTIKPLFNSRLGLVGLAIALTLGMANTNKSRADDSTGESRDKIAEMTALVRHSEHCPEVPSSGPLHI